MKKVLRFVHWNLEWIFIGVVYLLFCWVMYQQTKDTLSWKYIILMCMLGLGSGVIVVTKIIGPSRCFDAKISKWFSIKKST